MIVTEVLRNALPARLARAQVRLENGQLHAGEQLGVQLRPVRRHEEHHNLDAKYYMPSCGSLNGPSDYVQVKNAVTCCGTLAWVPTHSPHARRRTASAKRAMPMASLGTMADTSRHRHMCWGSNSVGGR